MTAYPALVDMDVFRKTVLLRIDANFDVQPDGTTDHIIALEAIRPSVEGIIKAGGRVVLLGHKGQPAGRAQSELSLRPLALALSTHLQRDVRFVPDCIGRGVEQAIADTPYGHILLLENTRFHQADELGDAAFAAQLAAHADVCVFDALAAAHFAHASTTGIIAHLPSALGVHAAATLQTIDTCLHNPKKPLLAIIGGAKLSTRLDVLQSLVLKADMLLLGGGVANTFLEAKDMNVGHSLIEPACIEPARDILAEAGIVGCRILLPQDVVTAPEKVPNAPHETKAVDAVADQDVILDVGPQTTKTWASVMQKAGTILWFGPVGAHEIMPFQTGSHAVAAALTATDAISIASGQDTLSCILAAGAAADITCATTAEHAFLALLAGRGLPVLKALVA